MRLGSSPRSPARRCGTRTRARAPRRKPSNVLLDLAARPDGSDHAYLADFGLTSRGRDEQIAGGDGHLLGTIDYVAPEQIAGEDVGPRADVYSLGCTSSTSASSGSHPSARARARRGLRPPRDGAAAGQRATVRRPAGSGCRALRALARSPSSGTSCREFARAALAVAVDEASRRLVDVASRAAAGRSRLTEVELELAAGDSNLQVAREQVRALARPPTPARVAALGICPFKGLASFEPVGPGLLLRA